MVALAASTGIVDAPGRDTFQKTVYANIELLR
jgi:hypothetical protein